MIADALPLDHPEVLAAAEADPRAARLRERLLERGLDVRIAPGELLRAATSERTDPWAEGFPGPRGARWLPSGRWPDHAQRRPFRKGNGQVAVIVPSRDRPASFARAVLAACDQYYGDWRLYAVLSDPAASDPDYLQGLGRRTRDERLSVLRAPRLAGSAQAINLGLQAAKGCEFAAVLDDDDQTWRADFLGRLVAELAADRTLGLAYAGAGVGADSTHPPMTGHFRAALAAGPWFGFSRAVWRRELLWPGGLSAEAGGAADWEAWLRIAEVAGAFHVGEALVSRPWDGQGRPTVADAAGRAWVAEGLRSGRYGEPITAVATTLAPPRPDFKAEAARLRRGLSCVFRNREGCGCGGKARCMHASRLGTREEIVDLQTCANCPVFEPRAGALPVRLLGTAFRTRETRPAPEPEPMMAVTTDPVMNYWRGG